MKLTFTADDFKVDSSSYGLITCEQAAKQANAKFEEWMKTQELRGEIRDYCGVKHDEPG